MVNPSPLERMTDQVDLAFVVASDGDNSFSGYSSEDLLSFFYKIREGEVAEELFRRHYNSIKKVALGFLDNEQDAEDIAMKLFTDLVLDGKSRNLVRNYNEGEATYLKGYLHRSVVNKSINELNRAARNKEVSFDFQGDSDYCVSSYDFEGLKILEERIRSLGVAIAKIPVVNQRNSMRLRFQGLSYPDIADNLGIPIGTVMSSIHRGKKYIAKNFPELGPY